MRLWKQLERVTGHSLEGTTVAGDSELRIPSTATPELARPCGWSSKRSRLGEGGLQDGAGRKRAISAPGRPHR